MKKRILSLLLAAMMVVSIFVMPTSVSAADAEPLYSWDGFRPNDIRNAYDGQVIDLGFDGPVATAPILDGEIGDDEYTKSNTIPLMNDESYSIDVSYAVHGNYLYIAVDQANAYLSGDPSQRYPIQMDVGVAANYSAETTWHRLAMGVSADGVVSTTASAYAHEMGATEYQQSSSSVRTSDYLVDNAFDWGVYEFKLDLGQLYRFYANAPGGQEAWNSPCVNFAFWINNGGLKHYCLKVSPNFKNANGRSGDWVSYTVLIPEVTLNSLEAQYKGVIAPLGYDYRNAVAGQLVSVKDYATVAPTVDGAVTVADAYTTTGSWANTNYATALNGAIDCNFSVINGYLYGALECNVKFTDLVHFGIFGAPNSSNIHDSRSQISIKTDGSWGISNNLWKNAQGPTTAGGGNWANTELNCSGSAHSAWEKVVTVYNETTGKSTIEFQVSIPELLAILHFEGYNTQESNAVALYFWPAQAGVVGFTVDSATQTKIKQTNGYGYGFSNVHPVVELPKGCSEDYFIEDVDDMGPFGQRIVEAKQSVANVDGAIGAGEYTASNHYNSEDLISYNANDKGTPAPIEYDISQTDYYSYDENYFYYGAKIYDPYYKAGSSLLQMNISVLNKHDPYTVTNTYVKTAGGSATIVKTIRENYIDIADVITRASWDNKLYDDHVGTSAESKPGSVIRSQTLKNGTLAADAQAAFKARANTFGDAGYEFAGSYDAATKTYTFETKIPLDELKNLFQLGDDYDIDSINVYTLYKFTEPDTGKGDYAMSYEIRDNSWNPAWDALKTLTQASKASTGTPYDQNTVPNVIKLVDEAYTKETASVRISTSVSGLRFKSVYTNDYLAYMAKYAAVKGETMEIGTLIAPKDYVDAAGAFTHAALFAKYGAKGYVEVPAVQATPFQNVNGVTTFAGSLVNIKESNLDRDFAGIGFIKVGNEYFYTDTYAVKNVSDVASAALADTKTAKQAGYNYEVSAGVWSPYTEGQRLVLEALVA